MPKKTFFNVRSTVAAGVDTVRFHWATSRWFRKAAEQGNEDAKDFLRQIEAK